MKNLFVTPKTSLIQAMKILDKTGERCLMVVDENQRLLGTLTDGDLRRSILSGLKFSMGISSSYQTKPTVLEKNKYTLKEARDLLVDMKLDLIPVIDNKRKVSDYLTLSIIDGGRNENQDLYNIPVVIMAGGKGSRMKPFTNILPKPLVPIDEKPIIETIIERFTNINSSDFYLTVNYKKNILKAYFKDLNPNYKVSFIEESKPLGTAGSLSFLKGRVNEPFFVTNCDIIIKTDYTSLFEFHKEGEYDLTLVASAKEFIIPYGTCDLNENGHLLRIHEKPKFDFLINAGLYILNHEILNLIPENKFYHITNLIQDAKDQGKKIGVYPVDDDAWIDVGQWVEYKKSIDKI